MNLEIFTKKYLFMTDYQTIKERLTLFIESKDLTPFSFEKQCGLSQGFVKNIRVNISPKMLEKITNTFSDLNPAWLMTGEGVMLRVDASAQSWEEAEDKEREKEINRLKKELSDLREMVAQLQEDKSNLSDTVKSLSRTLEAISQTSKKS